MLNSYYLELFKNITLTLYRKNENYSVVSKSMCARRNLCQSAGEIIIQIVIKSGHGKSQDAMYRVLGHLGNEDG
jgi:hypothetical protein